MVNGKPTCGNANSTAILRRSWGFKGYITSDTDACGDIYASHRFTDTPEAAAGLCVSSGTDIDSGGTYKNHLAKAVSGGHASRDDVNSALRNTYRMRMRLGLFNPEDVESSYRRVNKSVVGSAKHVSMSRHAARQSMVLLKNDHTLPFAKGCKVAVIGKSSNSTNDILGNYVGPLCPSGGTECVETLWEAIGRISGGGTPPTLHDRVSDVAGAVAAAKAAELVVLTVSNADDGGGEGHDRQTISLASDQQALAKAVLAVGKPTVLVMINGGIISIDDLKESAPAILEAFMPGQWGAGAVAETIFGDANPGGKMPVTMYSSDYISKVDFLDMSMQAGPGRSYRYYTGTPLYEFGAGLSYTTFDVKWQEDEDEQIVEHGKTVTAVITNTGTRAGDEVVFLYSRPAAETIKLPAPGVTPVPIKQLLAFRRVHLAAGASETVTFDVALEDLALVDHEGHRAVFPGLYTLEDGAGGAVTKVEVAGESATDADIVQPLEYKWW